MTSCIKTLKWQHKCDVSFLKFCQMIWHDWQISKLPVSCKPQMVLRMEMNCFQHVSNLCSCMCHLSHGWISPSNLLIFGGFAFVYAAAVCHLCWHCQVLLARACDWISKSSLAAALSLTVVSALVNLNSKMTHSFHSLHGHLLFAFPPEWKGEHILSPALEDCVQPAHILNHVSFTLSLSACLPPLLFVTMQPTFPPNFTALSHTLHNPLSNIARPVVHTFGMCFSLRECILATWTITVAPPDHSETNKLSLTYLFLIGLDFSQCRNYSVTFKLYKMI